MGLLGPQCGPSSDSHSAMQRHNTLAAACEPVTFKLVVSPQSTQSSAADLKLSDSPEAAHEVEGFHAVEVEAEQQSLGHHAQTQGPRGVLPAAQWAAVFGHAPGSRRLLQDHFLRDECTASAGNKPRG